MSAERVSTTAARIAANYVGAAREPRLRPLLLHPDEPYSGWFLEEVSPLLPRLWRWGPTRRLLYRTYERSTPGAALYLLLRKRWVEEQVRALLAESPAIEQVVVLGAGFDPLCLRLAHEYPNLRLYEIDHPATQSVKRRALEQRGAMPANLTLTPVDLTRASLDAALPRLRSYRATAPTLFLAEGLLMYLPEAEVGRVLATLRAQSGPGSRLIATFVDRERLEDPNSSIARMGQVLEQMGEPFRSSVPASMLEAYLREHGFQLGGTADGNTLKGQYLPAGERDQPVTDGEVMAVARKL